MTSSEVWTEQTAAHYDASAAAQFAPEVLNPTVDRTTYGAVAAS